jgi:hypothetical protein
MTKKLNLVEAVDAVMVKKGVGAHIFYYPEDDYFMVIRDSQNGSYAGDKIVRDLKYYIGFIQDPRGVGNKKERDHLSVGHVIFYLLSSLEISSNNFNQQLSSIISLSMET